MRAFFETARRRRTQKLIGDNRLLAVRDMLFSWLTCDAETSAPRLRVELMRVKVVPDLTVPLGRRSETNEITNWTVPVGRWFLAPSRTRRRP